jgi:hypothetical protein
VSSGPKREKVAGGWRILHIEELHNLYASPNIIRVIKSRPEHVARVGEMYKIFGSENLKEIDHL